MRPSEALAKHRDEVLAIIAKYPTRVCVSRLSPLAYLRATRHCKLYDFAAGRWLRYDAVS